MKRSISAVLVLALLGVSGAGFTYPAPPKDGTVTAYFGTNVRDPYRPLENIDAPAVTAWVRAEEQLTRSYLDAIPQRSIIAEHMKNMANYEKISAPDHMKNQYFFTRNSGLQNQSVLYTMEGPHGKPRVFIDPNALSADGTVALADDVPSWNARYVAYATQSSGSDWETWHVRSIRTGKDLADVLHWSKFGSASWMPDSRSFLYARYAEPKAGNERKGALYNQKIYLHRLGTPQSADTLFYSRRDHPDWFIGTSVTIDGRYAVMTTNEGTSPNNRVYYIDLHDPKRTVHAIFDKGDANYSYLDNVGSTWYFQTTKDAANGKVIALDPRDPSKVRTILPESKSALEYVGTAGHRMFAAYLVDAHSAVSEYDYQGKKLRDIALPGLGSASGFAGWPGDRTVYYSYAGYTSPGTIYSYDIASGKTALYRKPKVDFDARAFETREVFYTSKDGTRVPMMISYKKGLKLDGTNPTLLYAYGGFDISMTPSFSTIRTTWMQMGGIYAVASIRGGAEYGEAWHRAGMLLKKQNVFDDFIAAAHYLIDNHYTSTPKLAVNGASNGGLLIGAVETQVPELFGAAVPQVGVLDMLRFDKFTVGNAWIPEYGCATCSKDQFENLLRYSPYQNVKAGTHYPPTLILTSDHDDRVFPAHSFKFVAAMQAAQSGDAPVLLRIESKAGHGGGIPLMKSINEYADIYAFLMKNLDMTLPAGFH
ncbi:MAG TPA: prolyl oligopeptidase family serine peptidase [Candidatus Baltobacteraceae bacterium]|nr:prolyl oligopeptidase family serine peptidase [Candidatus Baltobacteraceae bacterium]